MMIWKITVRARAEWNNSETYLLRAKTMEVACGIAVKKAHSKGIPAPHCTSAKLVGNADN